MIRFLKNSFLIAMEFAVLVLFILWYLQACEYEPLIGIITSSVALITSFSFKLLSKPKIELYQQRTDYGRYNQGFSANNPRIIKLGVDKPNVHWKLFWNFDIEIRNNSSQNAYSISFEYLNMPQKTFIGNELGVIEPILAHEKKTIRIKLFQEVESNHEIADNYLKENATKLMLGVKIIVKYKDESRATYFTEFEWSTNRNKFKICR